MFAAKMDFPASKLVSKKLIILYMFNFKFVIN